MRYYIILLVFNFFHMQKMTQTSQRKYHSVYWNIRVHHSTEMSVRQKMCCIFLPPFSMAGQNLLHIKYINDLVTVAIQYLNLVLLTSEYSQPWLKRFLTEINTICEQFALSKPMYWYHEFETKHHTGIQCLLGVVYLKQVNWLLLTAIG